LYCIPKHTLSLSINKIDEKDTIREQEEEKEDHENERQKKIHRRRNEKSLDSGYYMDHVTRSIIRYLNKKLIRYYDVFFYYYYDDGFSWGLNVEDYKFGSEDILVDEEIYRKLSKVKIIEDALLLKISKKL